MMKIMNWLNSPVTWGGYLKLCGIVCAISIVIYGISFCIIWQPDWLTNLASFVKKPFTKKEIDE